MVSLGPCAILLLKSTPNIVPLLAQFDPITERLRDAYDVEVLTVHIDICHGNRGSAENTVHPLRTVQIGHGGDRPAAQALHCVDRQRR